MDKRSEKIFGKIICLVCMLSACAFSAAPAAEAGTLELGAVFNGIAPTSAAPWIAIHFSDLTTNQVQLTITSSLEVGSEFIDQIAFNLNPEKAPADLIFNPSTPLDATPSITTGTNNLQLVGSGNKGKGFDISMEWAANSFNGSEIVTYILSLPNSGNLSAADFSFKNASDLFAGAHIQGIPLADGTTTSGAVTVPEPAFALMLGIGFGVFGLVGWRVKK